MFDRILNKFLHVESSCLSFRLCDKNLLNVNSFMNDVAIARSSLTFCFSFICSIHASSFDILLFSKFTGLDEVIREHKQW